MSDKLPLQCAWQIFRGDFKKNCSSDPKELLGSVFYFFSRFFSLRNEFHIFGIYYLVTVSPDSLIRHSTSTRDCYNLGVWNLIKLCHSPRVHHNTPVGLVRQSKLSKWQIPPQKMQQLPPHIVCRRTWCSYTLSSFLLCTTQGQSRGKTIGLVQNAFPLSFRSH